MHGTHCCTLTCMGHTAVHCHAWGTLLYSAMHGAHFCILTCMGHTAIHCHAWGTLLYIAMHGAHCCTLTCMGHAAVQCHAWGLYIYTYIVTSLHCDLPIQPSPSDWYSVKCVRIEGECMGQAGAQLLWVYYPA